MEKIIWIVVQVEKGIPVFIRVFKKEYSAIKYEKEIRTHMNPDNDEIAIFRISI